MNRVKEFREALGWSGKILAERVRLSQSEIYFIERETHKPRPKTMKRIARAFGKPWTEVFPEYMTMAARVMAARVNPKKSKCQWCGNSYGPEDHAALVVGGKVILERGHESCLKEYIRTERFG